MVYTDATKIEQELRATTQFSASTVPTLSSVNRWITETENYIDSLAGQSFGSTAATEYFDYDLSDKSIYLRHTPFISLQEVAYNVSALGVVPSYVEKTEDEDFTLYEDDGRIQINPNRWKPDPSHPKAVRVKYTYGYSSVPGRVAMLATKMVAKRVLDTLLFNNVNEANSGGSISVGSINIVEPANYGVGTYKELGTEIAKLKEDVLNQDFKVFRNG